jgi:hypothetical protein
MLPSPDPHAPKTGGPDLSRVADPAYKRAYNQAALAAGELRTHLRTCRKCYAPDNPLEGLCRKARQLELEHQATNQRLQELERA